MIKDIFKITVILLFIIVNSAQVQVKPATFAGGLNSLQKRKLLENNAILKDIKFPNVELPFGTNVSCYLKSPAFDKC